MADWQRSHTCGALRTEHLEQTVTLNGWIENHRDHGKVLFMDLRDRYGVTQVVFEADAGAEAAALLERVQKLGQEDVVAVEGTVRKRGEANLDRATGEIEVVATQVWILNEAEPPPFEVLDEVEANEELRMRYRYLDLRRRPLAEAMVARGRFVTAIRNHLAAHHFVDVETPILTKSTPEGARDYLVPSRVHPGNFYALPQSPQIFKQLCMVAGLDRYYQIARCFRDEDLRADRQPEFTQVDLEMSFVEEEDVLSLVEGMVVDAMKQGFGIDLPTPFPRLTYADAMLRYGSDKPDLRYGMEITDICGIAKDCGFKVFSGAVERGGVVRGIVAEGAAERFSRKDIEKGLGEFASGYGAKGLAWAKVDGGKLTGSIAKFFEGDAGTQLIEAMGAKDKDLVLFVADRKHIAERVLGELRHHLGSLLGLRPKDTFLCGWVTAFPLFEQDPDSGEWFSSHHPFTAPDDWDADLQANPGGVNSRAYDLVMNGWELGSGSVRIHRADVQQKIFDVLGISPEEQQTKFGFLLDAFRYGAPPHAGIALGVDRMVTLALGADSIRDVIAFPKTTAAADLMCQAPSQVAEAQLEELRLASLKEAPEQASEESPAS